MTPAGNRHRRKPSCRPNLLARFPLLEDADGSTFDAYKTTGVPTTYLLDAEAKVVGFRSGGTGGCQAGTDPGRRCPGGDRDSR